MNMNKVSEKEMAAWNEASLKWMRDLRAELREEVIAEEDGKEINLNRLGITIIIVMIAISILALTVLRQGLSAFGTTIMIGVALGMIVGAAILAWKWSKEFDDDSEYVTVDEEEEELDTLDNTVQ